jgi:RNA polymerase sigma-70 factor (ECF subfamily)
LIRKTGGLSPLTHEPQPDLDALFREHARYVWRCLRHLGVADADVDDVCQEVFITAQRKLPEFEGRSSLRSWLYGIALRIASDHRRSAYVRRERAVADPGELDDPASNHASQASSEARQTLSSLLALLDQERRDIVVLYEIEGFTMKEVAELVGCPLQTAYSRLYSARTALAEAAKLRGSKAHG